MNMALKGIKVIEFLGLAPGPFCGAILADFGASVTVVSKMEPSPFDVFSNGKKIISLNMKSKEGIEIVKKICKTSDVLLDTFRPGVMENLGLGPDLLTSANPRLIYARLTGYGQTGPLKSKGGHDINYVAMSGILSLLRKKEESPVPPLNLLADFAGGSVLCSFGILLALFERTKSGKGQIIDNGMTDGLAYIASWLFRTRFLPIWQGEPGTNLLDGGFAAYGTYKTKDGKYMAVGALEPKFYSNFLKGLQLSENDYDQYGDSEIYKTKFQEIFLQKTQSEWSQIFDKLDACVTPVLDIDSLHANEYYKTKGLTKYDSNNMIVPEPSPKLNRTPGVSVGTQPQNAHGQHTLEILMDLGYTKTEINKLIQKSVVYADLKSNL